jgi:hypothetical protein
MPHREQVLLGGAVAGGVLVTVVERLGEARVLEGTGHVVVGAPVTVPAEDPHPILDDRTASDRVEIPDLVDQVGALETLRNLRRIEVVALERPVREPRLE